MKISLQNLGTVNQNKVTLTNSNASLTLYFSYETLVGVGYSLYEKNNFYKTGVLCLENYWHSTTGKLLNIIEPNKKKRVNQEIFDSQLEFIFNHFNKYEKTNHRK